MRKLLERKQNFVNKLKGGCNLVPCLVLMLTISLPILHLSKSRIYNYRVALVELVIIFFALLIYRKSMVLHFFRVGVWGGVVIALLLIGVLAAIYSDYQGRSFIRVLSVSIWVAYFWLLVFLIRSGELAGDSLLLAVAISIVIPIAYFLYLTAVYPTRSSLYFIIKNFYMYSHIRHFGYHLTIVSVILAYFIISSRIPKVIRCLGVVFLGLNMGILLWTMSRQGVLFSSVFLFIILLVKSRGGRGWGVSWSVVLLIVLAASLLLAQEGDGLLTRFISRFQGWEDLEKFSSGRVGMWLDTLALIKERGVLGHGPDTFYNIYSVSAGSIALHPHSVLLQIAFGWGVVGLFLFVLIIGKLLTKLKCRKNTEDVLFVSSCGMLLILVNSQIDGQFYHVLPVYYFSIFSAIVVAGEVVRPKNA